MNININMNNNNSKNKIYFNDGSCGNIIDNKNCNKNPLSIEFETIKFTSNKKSLNAKVKSPESNIKKINKNKIINIFNNNKTLSTDKKYYFETLGHSPIKPNNVNENIKNNNLIVEELNKKKKIILPLGKEINNINININGCNVHNGCLTSRTSNKVSKKKYKGIFNTNGQEIKYYNQEFKIKVKDKNNIKKNNNIISRNDNNPIKINKLYDNSNNYNYNFENPRISGFLTYKK